MTVGRVLLLAIVATAVLAIAVAVPGQANGGPLSVCRPETAQLGGVAPIEDERNPVADAILGPDGCKSSEPGGTGGGDEEPGEPACEMPADLCDYFPLYETALEKVEEANRTVQEAVSDPPEPPGLPPAPAPPAPPSPPELPAPPPVPEPIPGPGPSPVPAQDPAEPGDPEPASPSPPQLPEPVEAILPRDVATLTSAKIDPSPPEDPIPSPETEPIVEPRALVSRAPAKPLRVDGGVVLVLLTYGLVLYLPFALFYNRLTRARVDRNPLRRRVLDYVLAHPGTTCGEVAQAAGVHYTTAEHHLRILQRFRLIVCHAGPLGRRFFENGGRFPASMRSDLALLRNPANQAVLRAAGRPGGCCLSEVAALLGVTPSTAGYRIARLASAGLLARDARVYAVTPRGLAALASGSSEPMAGAVAQARAPELVPQLGRPVPAPSANLF